MQQGDKLHLANVIVIGVMAWCDLQCSCPKLSIHIFVSNDGNPPAQPMMVVRQYSHKVARITIVALPAKLPAAGGIAYWRALHTALQTLQRSDWCRAT